MIVLKAHTALAIQWTLVIVSMVFVLLRLFVRIRYFRQFGAADFLVVLALGCMTTSHFLNLYLNQWGFWNPGIIFQQSAHPAFNKHVVNKVLLVKGLKILYANNQLYYGGLYSVKAAFLILYFKVFPPALGRLRFALVAVTVLIAVGYLSTTVMNMFLCQPVRSNWTADDFPIRCITYSKLRVYFFTNSFHIISDILVYALPFFLLPTLLQRTRARSLATIVTIFSLGALCVMCSLIRIACIGKATTLPLFGAMGAIDLGTGICVCCCPIIKQGFDIRLHEHAVSTSARTPGSKPSSGPEKRSSRSQMRSRNNSRNKTTSSRILGVLTGTIFRQTNSERTRGEGLEDGDAIGMDSTVELDRTAVFSNLEDEADELESGVGFGLNRQTGPSGGGLAPRIRRTESANTVPDTLNVVRTREHDREIDANANNSAEVLAIEGSPAAQSLLRPPPSPAKVKRSKMKLFGTSTFGSNSTFGSANRSFGGSSQLNSFSRR